MCRQFIDPSGRQVHSNQNLDVHAVTSGTSRSSIRYAAYVKHWSMSLASRYGYALRISSRDRPTASNPSTVPTVTRWPRIQGLPPITAGSKVMRSNCAIYGYLLLSSTNAMIWRAGSANSTRPCTIARSVKLTVCHASHAVTSILASILLRLLAPARPPPAAGRGQAGVVMVVPQGTCA